jgi:hypothetical protein
MREVPLQAHAISRSKDGPSVEVSVIHEETMGGGESKTGQLVMEHTCGESALKKRRMFIYPYEREG